jgi:hypothetical protein
MARTALEPQYVVKMIEIKLRYIACLNDSSPVPTSIRLGIGIISHGLSAFEVFNLLSPEWEKKQIEKN